MSATMQLRRVCGCGCGTSLPAELRKGTIYLNDKHRDRVKKRRSWATARAQREVMRPLEPPPPYGVAAFCECPRPAGEIWPKVGPVCVWCGHVVRSGRRAVA
jgi:hypothetical protein